MALTSLMADHREGHDDYQGEVFRSGDYRVVECRDGLQWIAQRRVGKRSGRARWDAFGYCRTRKGLSRLYQWPEALISALPARIGGDRQ